MANIMEEYLFSDKYQDSLWRTPSGINRYDAFMDCAKEAKYTDNDYSKSLMFFQQAQKIVDTKEVKSEIKKIESACNVWTTDDWLHRKNEQIEILKKRLKSAGLRSEVTSEDLLRRHYEINPQNIWIEPGDPSLKFKTEETIRLRDENIVLKNKVKSAESSLELEIERGIWLSDKNSDLRKRVIDDDSWFKIQTKEMEIKTAELIRLHSEIDDGMKKMNSLEESSKLMAESLKSKEESLKSKEKSSKLTDKEMVTLKRKFESANTGEKMYKKQCKAADKRIESLKKVEENSKMYKEHWEASQQKYELLNKKLQTSTKQLAIKNECNMCRKERISRVLSCGHMFCSSCTGQFLTTKCPTCKQVPKDIQQNYQKLLFTT